MLIKSKILLLFIFTFLIFTSCNEGLPVIPGLVKSEINVQSDPPGASVRFNNKTTSVVTPGALKDLEPGFYRVDVIKEHYLDTTFYLLLQRKKTETIKTELREDPSYWWKTYNRTNSTMPDNNVNCLFVDNDNVLWIGTNNGLVSLDNDVFSIYSTGNGKLPVNSIRVITMDKNGFYWLGTSNGLIRFDKNSYVHYTAGNSRLPDNTITSITVGKNNDLWIGTFSGGMVKFDGVSFTVFNIYNSDIPSNSIRALVYQPSSELLWIGTSNQGLVKFNGTSFQSFNIYNSFLPSNYISKIILYDESNIIVGTGQPGGNVGGLRMFNGSIFIFIASNLSFTEGVVLDIILDSEKNIWFSTINGGLRYYNPQKQKIFNTGNSGLVSNTITSIAIDKNNIKWAGNTGLSKYIGMR